MRVYFAKVTKKVVATSAFPVIYCDHIGDLTEEMIHEDNPPETGFRFIKKGC